MESTLFVLLRLLDNLHIGYDKEDVKLRLLSDVEYPSLLSVTNVLDFLCIKYVPCKIKFEHLIENKTCKIVHIENGNKTLFANIEHIDCKSVTYYDGSTHVVSIEDFKAIWTSVAILVYPSQNTKKISLTWKSIIPLLYSIIGLFILVVGIHKGISFLPFCAFLGVIVSCHLMKIESDKRYYSRFCQINSKFDCRKVISTNGTSYVSLAECNFFIFLGILTYMLISADPITAANWVRLFSLCLIPVLLFLIVYQTFVLKHWCLLCVCTSFIYLAIGLSGFDYDGVRLSVPAVSFLTSFSLSFLITLLLKQHLVALKKYKDDRIASYSFKRNPYILKEFLTSKKYIALDYDDAIFLGNNESSIIMTTIITPNCPHCEHVVKEMFDLINIYPIKWIIIWNGTTLYPTANKEQLYWEELYKLNRQTFQDELYKFVSSGKYKAISMSDTSEQTKLSFFKRLEVLEKNEINRNPTILINGKIISKYYKVDDFEYILSELINTEIP